ncbi:regulatory protein, luxR family [Actinacidiphila yanglinensis]|uniref:Regulatory protein, luxR family n=1 Tax=Actinacidiphila yanglinensis TaxID=310779 RepID=A0A1H6DDH8_9ACTN|nr:LuxR family transcriptional regulator [Actinacidiphila yanglinensis]SEG83261.1 regulatory protein, luxR family [Actinacidiphila yanglinensis]
MTGLPPAGTRTRPVPLTGRHEELRLLADLVEGVRDGMSGALLLVGEAGIGKTTLLDHVAGTSTDLRVVRAAGTESEARLGHAALHRLLRPFLRRLDVLPAPQHEALASAFGMLAAPPADRYLVGMATLTLLADATAEQPLLCLVDDVQWLDRESRDALAFVGRRLGAEAVGLVLAGRRQLPGPGAFEGFNTLTMGGLADTDAHALLGRNVAGRLDAAVAARIVADTGGNPLALIESVDTLSPAHLAGTAPLFEPLPVGARLEHHFGQLVRGLPAETRTLLVLLSAAPPEDPPLLWRAAAELGVPANAVDAAISAGVLTRGRIVEFRHPLIRSAVYTAADPAERRRVHAALAAVSDPVQHPERRAWHRAEATVGLDDEVAGELVEASERAGARGGYAARAAFLARAAELSEADRSVRAVRLVEAARAHLVLGDPVAAQAMIEQAEPLLATGDPVLRARALHARATTDLYFERIDGVVPQLLAAADTVAGTDPVLARSMLLEGLLAALCSAHETLSAREFGTAVLTSPAMRSAPPAGTDLLLRGFALRMDSGYAPSVPVLRAALAAMGRDGHVIEGGARQSTLALYAAEEIWDDAGGEEAARLVEAHERRIGALGALRSTLVVRSTWELRAGRFAAATACLDEAEELAAVIGQPSGLAFRVELLAWSGQEARARAAADALVQDLVTRHAHGGLGDWARNCLAVLELGLGRYAEAAACARVAFDHDNAGAVPRALPDLVEASVRCGDHRTAKEALRRLEERAPLAGTPWALGLLARCRALMADDDQAGAFFAESAALLGRTGVRTDLARTHLLHGEWLRRRGRRADARAELRTAHEMFAGMGAAAFAERARLELLATGERARKRTVQTEHDLTPQERRIAGLAADGSTNAEIAARLFITTSTVEYHLNKVFRKLDITSRRQLRSVLGAAT